MDHATPSTMTAGILNYLCVDMTRANLYLRRDYAFMNFRKV